MKKDEQNKCFPASIDPDDAVRIYNMGIIAGKEYSKPSPETEKRLHRLEIGYAILVLVGSLVWAYGQFYAR